MMRMCNYFERVRLYFLHTVLLRVTREKKLSLLLLLSIPFISLPQTNEEILFGIMESIHNRESKLKGDVKSLKVEFIIEASQDKAYMEWEFERLKSEIAKQQGSFKIGKPIPIAPLKCYVWQIKGNKIRLEEKKPENQKLLLLGLFDGEKYYYYAYTQYTESNKTPVARSSMLISNRLYPTDQHTDLFAPWRFLGLMMEQQFLSEELKGYKVGLVGREKIDDATCYVVEIKRDVEIKFESSTKMITERKRLWYEPVLGVVRQIAVYSEDNALLYSWKGKNFKQCLEGVYLPMEAESIIYSGAEYKKNHPILVRKFVVKQMEINQGIPDELFSPPTLPKGSIIMDEIIGRTYTVGEKLPSDEDILQIAKVARDFLEGRRSISQIIEEYKDKGKSESYNCGPNALLAVCGILGVETTSKKIAELSGADEKGFTSMAGLKRAAEALGLKAEGMDLTLEELKKENKLAIAWLPPGHYIVVVGFAEDKVVIIDPPTALTVIPIYGLDNLWDGRVLLVSKR